MTERDVSDYDMPNFHWSSGKDGAADLPDPVLAALLAGTAHPVDSAQVQQLADVLAVLRSAPASDELAGKDVALAEFRGRIGVSTHSNRPLRRRPHLLPSLLSAKAAAAIAAVAVGVGGVATAAYAGKLPAAVQQFAHDTIGAPAGHPANHSGSHGNAAQAVGPNATGHSAYGLCTAYAHATAHGTAAQKSVAFRNLVKAAGGASNVTSFCAAVPHPGSSQSPAAHPTGKPTAQPSHPAPTATPSHPTGKPTSHPTTAPAHS